MGTGAPFPLCHDHGRKRVSCTYRVLCVLTLAFSILIQRFVEARGLFFSKRILPCWGRKRGLPALPGDRAESSLGELRTAGSPRFHPSTGLVRQVLYFLESS